MNDENMKLLMEIRDMLRAIVTNTGDTHREVTDLHNTILARPTSSQDDKADTDTKGNADVA